MLSRNVAAQHVAVAVAQTSTFDVDDMPADALLFQTGYLTIAPATW